NGALALIAAALTGAQFVMIAAGWCAVARPAITSAVAGSAGPVISRNPALSMQALSIATSGHAKSVSRTVGGELMQADAD
ncbi:MAG TPA: hypothetical protein VFU61_06785, partial [Steroidobacteraceae bacterium]|nr:hypothetical protein [Steroidobacteraceae bacterium]